MSCSAPKVPGNILEIETISPANIRSLVDVLKDLVTDTPIVFDSGGLLVRAMSPERHFIVHMRLDADKFQHYYCNELFVGINMLNLHKFMRTLDKSSQDVLVMSINENDPNHMCICLENADKRQRIKFSLNLIDLNNPHIMPLPTEFTASIQLASADFLKLCRDMVTVSKVVEIKSVGNQIWFSCSGDIGKYEQVMVSDREDADSADPATEEIVQGVFLLKYLNLFSKCATLSPAVELFMANDQPLVVRYQVASLGEIKLAMASMAPDDFYVYN
jgi:proliferating cell nuclear antigen